uniref:ARAD1B07326p n=1 Tax=Blastobotrys adeninivorans TaxID=409370 RepID=A0A060TAK9_BLAAD
MYTMSATHDPMEKILDTFYDWKGQGVQVLNKTVDTITSTDAYQKVAGLVKNADRNSISTLINPPPPPPPSLWERVTDWVSRHKLLVSAIATVTVSGSLYYVYTVTYHQPSRRQRRRAKRAANNGRTEVVLIAGSPAEPITRLLAVDLDRRGFVVYWTTSSQEEEAIVRKENSVDIRPLPIKGNEASAIEDCIRKFNQEVLSVPVVAFPGAEPYQLSLAGVIVVPDLYFPAGPVESIRANTWSDLMYSKLLGPVFLLSGGLLDLVRRHNSRVLLLTPTIMSSLKPAFHAPECISSAALESMALCMHRELKPQGIPFVHLKLGSFDVAPGRSSPGSHARQVATSIRADILSWPEPIRALYSRAYQASAHLHSPRTTGSSMRVLNHAVFDALTQDKPKRVWYVGRGSYAYEWLTSWFSESAVTWLLQPPSQSAPIERDWETV